MGEEQQHYIFTYKEVVEALIMKQDLHEGIWGVLLKFGIGGANIRRPGEEDAVPAAIVPVLEIGLQKMDKVTAISLNAALVNPAQVKQSRSRSTSVRKSK